MDVVSISNEKTESAESKLKRDNYKYFYQLHDEKYPSKKLFATCFEFGTFGDSLPAQIRSMRITILKNRMFQFGVKSNALRKMVIKEYEELFSLLSKSGAKKP